jgi:dolichyl-phosphate-mannose-protein mannosyltransferase
VPKRRTKSKNLRRRDSACRSLPPTPVVPRFLHLPVLISLSGIICLIVAVHLHSSWVGLPWLAGIGLWGYFFWSVDTSSVPDHAQFPVARLLAVLTAASIVRWFKISELPLGPAADEIFTLNNSIDLLPRPFDLFGHTPLLVEGWVETTNLYLYFNLLIVKLFGVSYSSMKLFSVLPGIIACGAVFLIGRLVFAERIAFLTALLFAFAHWPVRLSRYGWDVSFMIMTFALSIGLMVFALQRLRLFQAYLSGIAAGVCLYSYLGARICVLSLLAFLVWESRADNRRTVIRQSMAFAAGGALVAFPLLVYYVANPRAFWIRATELSVFNSASPLAVIIDNSRRHALMFFMQGGVYARDNYPGLAMLDPLAGIFFVVGLIVMFRLKNSAVRLSACTLVINFAPGIFSFSQERAPCLPNRRAHDSDIHSNRLRPTNDCRLCRKIFVVETN